MIENVLELVKVTENFKDSQTRQKKASCGPRAVALPESELYEGPRHKPCWNKAFAGRAAA